ncbi:MAG: hypothetical protein H7235_10430 [Bdellovibrionaceae bacterium]|nr:hypothetical protein [Pseudobdellovibrionaceae bacterium]
MPQLRFNKWVSARSKRYINSKRARARNITIEIKKSQTFLNGSPFDLLSNRTLVMHASTVIGGSLDMVILEKVELNNGNVEDIKFCKLQKANGTLYPSGTFIPAGQ